MSKAILFERVFSDYKIELRLYRYALRHQPGLIRFWPLRLLGLLLSCFGIRVDRLLWSWLPHCKKELLSRFWDKWEKKLPPLCREERTCLLSRMPEKALSPLMDKGYWVYCGETWAAARHNAGEPATVVDCWPPVFSKEETVYLDKGTVYKTLSPYLKRKLLRGLITFLSLTGFGVALGLLSLYFATGYYCMDLYKTYLSIPLTMVLNIAPVVVLCWFSYLLCNSVWGAGLISSVLTVGLSVADYLMLILRDDPLLFTDLGYAKEGGGMAFARYDVDPGLRTYITVLLCILAILFAAKFLRGRLRLRPVRLAGLCLIGALSVVTVKNVYYSGVIYHKTENNALTSAWSSTGLFISRGFVYPFLNSIQYAKHSPPEGYSDKAAQQILNEYGYDDMPEEKKVHIVAIMLEAYSDFTRFDAPTLSESVYAPLNTLRETSYYGNLITNIFAGGTVDTEWSFLTGFSTPSDFRANANSYVRYLKEQGYYTEGSHPSYQWFYNRQNVNRYLGFDNYYFYENRYNTGISDILLDDGLFQDIGDLLEQHLRTSDQPYFNFSVTYQNHGPYDSETYWYEGDYVVNDGYTDEEYNMLQNYFAGIANTSENVLKLADRIDTLDEPVVYIVFGDHMPWMGNGNSGYQRLGIDLNGENGVYNTYATPYLIHANAAAKEALGFDFVGEGPDISPCFLMNLLFQNSGLGGNEFMKLGNDMMTVSQIVHVSGLFLKDGVLTNTLTPEEKEIRTRYQIAKYYWRYHFVNRASD